MPTIAVQCSVQQAMLTHCNYSNDGGGDDDDDDDDDDDSDVRVQCQRSKNTQVLVVYVNINCQLIRKARKVAQISLL